MKKFKYVVTGVSTLGDLNSMKKLLDDSQENYELTIIDESVEGVKEMKSLWEYPKLTKDHIRKIADNIGINFHMMEFMLEDYHYLHDLLDSKIFTKHNDFIIDLINKQTGKRVIKKTDPFHPNSPFEPYIENKNEQNFE